MGRLAIGGAMLLVFGLLFILRGIVQGDLAEVGLGVPGLLIGIGALASYKLNR